MPRFIAIIKRPSALERGREIETFENVVAANKEEAEAKLRLYHQTASSIELWDSWPTTTMTRSVMNENEEYAKELAREWFHKGWLANYDYDEDPKEVNDAFEDNWKENQ